MLFDGVEDWNPETAGWLEKYQINLDVNILVAKDIGKGGALALHHNL